MRWPAAMAFAAVFVAGCHRTPQALDPFLPNTRIPPPPTGAAAGAPDAYYTSPTPPYSGAAPAYAPATGGAAATGSNGPFAPSGGYQQSPSMPAGGIGPVPAPINQSGAAPAGQGRTDSQTVRLVSHEEPSHLPSVNDEPSTVYERGGITKTSQASANRQAQPVDAVDIMDLPPVVRLPRQTARKPQADSLYRVAEMGWQPD